MIKVICDICTKEVVCPLPPPKGGGLWVHEPYLCVEITQGKHSEDDEPERKRHYITHICPACAARIVNNIFTELARGDGPGAYRELKTDGMTEAQAEWLRTHPQYRRVEGKPNADVRYEDDGTLYADGQFVPHGTGAITSVVVKPGCFAVGIRFTRLPDSMLDVRG